MPIKNRDYQFINLQHFDSPDLPNSYINMDVNFMDRIELIGHYLNKFLIVNSGYRTNARNKNVKGSPSSSHLRGFACDIHCTTSRDRFDIITTAKKVGINRIGVYKSHIHLDRDIHKTSNVIWYV